MSRGIRVLTAGLFVKVRDKAVFGLAGLAGRVSLTLTFRCRVNLPASNTSPSPMSRPSRWSVFSMSVDFLGASKGSSEIRRGDRLFLRCWSLSVKFTGPEGSTSPSKVSSSLSAVMELETLGLSAEAEELRADRPSRRVPPNLVPRLPSPQSKSSACDDGVFGMSFLVESLSFPSNGSSKSTSKSLSTPVGFDSF